MRIAEDPVYARAIKRQQYEDFRKYSKAPPFRRTIAALIDLVLGGVPAIYGFIKTESYAFAIPLLAYLLVRDRVLRGRSIGKAVLGLVVVHPETFAPCTLCQSLIRNSLYATVGPTLLLVLLTTFGIGAMFLPVGLLLFAFSRVSPLLLIGYDSENGRTAPDTWAKTHVLTPKEIATIIKLRNEAEGIG